MASKFQEEVALSDNDTSSTQVLKKRSILKHDSLELISDVGRLRGVLRKDSSYDETFRRPILKNNVDDLEENSTRSVVFLKPGQMGNLGLRLTSPTI